MNAAGDAMVVWGAAFIDSFESSRFTPSSGFGDYQKLAGSSARDRDLTIDGAGNSTLLWILGVGKAARQVPDNDWEDAFEFDPDSRRDQDFMSVDGNEAGQIVAVWKLNTEDQVTIDNLVYAIYDPADEEWTYDFLVFEEGFIFQNDVAINANGDAIAVWQQSGLRASLYEAATGGWTVPRQLTEEILPGAYGAAYEPQVALDDNGNAIVVWDDGRGIGTGTRGSVWARRYDAATDWESPFILEAGSLDATHAQVEMDAAGNAFVVWLQDNTDADPWNDSFEIRARRYDVVDDQWEPEVLVHDSDTRVSNFGFNISVPLDIPALAVEPAGTAILVWSEEIEDDFLIRASRYDITETTPAWSPPENISGDAHSFAVFPDLAIDANGNAIAVWQAGDNEFFRSTDINEVWANRYTAP